MPAVRSAGNRKRSAELRKRLEAEPLTLPGHEGGDMHDPTDPGSEQRAPDRLRIVRTKIRGRECMP